jgi:hypothetical protein
MVCMLVAGVLFRNEFLFRKGECVGKVCNQGYSSCFDKSPFGGPRGREVQQRLHRGHRSRVEEAGECKPPASPALLGADPCIVGVSERLACGMLGQERAAD